MELQCIFKEIKTKRKIFRQSSAKHLQTFLHFSTVSVHHKWSRTRLLSAENEWASCLRICGTTAGLSNFKKICEILGFERQYPTGYPKAKFWRLSVENHKKSVVKHSTEKPILLNFVNLYNLLFKAVIKQTDSSLGDLIKKKQRPKT